MEDLFRRGDDAWIPAIPLGALPSLTREGELLDTSVSAAYAKMGRWPCVMKFAMYGEKYNDEEVFEDISRKYKPI